MSVVYLVRHGQASLFGRDYDKLSDLGVVQSGVVGEALAARGVRPSRVVRGNLERHRETSAHAKAAAGWDLVDEVDAGWAEIDHMDVIGALHPAYTSHAAMVDDLLTRPEPEHVFRTVFDDALAAWLAGGGAYAETHHQFRSRVDTALTSVVERLGLGGPGEGDADETIVVFSSGGPVAAVVATALGLDTAAWLRLSRLVINASVTKLVVGHQGAGLVSFNDHAHVEARGQLTFH